MDKITGKSSFNYTYVANQKSSNQKNNLSFKAHPQEIKRLESDLLKEQNLQVASLLSYLVNSSSSYPAAKTFLNNEPISIIRGFVESASIQKEKMISAATKTIEQARQSLKELTGHTDVIATYAKEKKDPILKLSAENSRLIINREKEDIVKSHMPQSYQGDHATSLKIFELGSSKVLAKNRANRHIHEILEALASKK